MTINPIVAPIAGHTGDVWSGIWLAEDIEAIRQGVMSRSWVDSTLGGVGAGLDALATLSDPTGALMQYGLSWLMEHIRPLSEALDWLAGDPATIAGHAQTWRNVATSMRADAADLDRGAAIDLSGWHGAAARAYDSWSAKQRTVLGGLASGADTMASITEGVAYLTAGVRTLVRDAVATVVSRAIEYAGEEVLSLGLATPWVIEQVSTLVAAWSARIDRLIAALKNSVARLTPLMRRLGGLIERMAQLLHDMHGTDGNPTKVRPPTGGGAPASAPLVAAPVNLDPAAIRFSQHSVTGAGAITDSMRSDGWVGTPIDVVRMPDGDLTTIDNTRVLAARQAGIDVSANVHGFDEPLPPDMIGRFTTRAGPVTTWGQAVGQRIGRQNATLRTTYPLGSWDEPTAR
ncbi:MAG TPA: WXG100 family type VII secretion target [Micromonosporaceae bacterium]